MLSCIIDCIILGKQSVLLVSEWQFVKLHVITCLIQNTSYSSPQWSSITACSTWTGQSLLAPTVKQEWQNLSAVLLGLFSTGTVFLDKFIDVSFDINKHAGSLFGFFYAKVDRVKLFQCVVQ